MKSETALKQVGMGWWPIVRKYFDAVKLLQQATDYEIEVTEVGHRIGMLSVKALTGDPLMQDILDRLAWTFERSSSKVCEVCGEKGYRRKSLPDCPNRCRKHFVELVNERDVQGTLQTI
jgi:hypothetical protein